MMAKLRRDWFNKLVNVIHQKRGFLINNMKGSTHHTKCMRILGEVTDQKLGVYVQCASKIEVAP